MGGIGSLNRQIFLLFYSLTLVSKKKLKQVSVLKHVDSKHRKQRLRIVYLFGNSAGMTSEFLY